MLTAKGEHRVFSDADLSTPIEEIERLRAELHGTVRRRHRIACSARIPDRGPPARTSRDDGPHLQPDAAQVAALRGLHDTQCGFKAFTAEAAVACFEPLRTLRFGFDAEVLLRARRLGWTVAEVPVRWEHKEDSRVSALRDSFGVLYDLMRLRFIVRR